jgi:hypothetical protein
MTTTLMIMLPNDETLAAQVEQSLAPHAEVMRPPPQTLSLETIALIAAIGASGASIAAASTEIVKHLLEIKQLLIEQGKADQAQIGSPATGTRTFAAADETFLKQLLGVDQ